MAKQTWINAGGTWRKVKSAWNNVNGVWKKDVMPKGVVSGNWKEFMQYLSMDVFVVTGAKTISRISNGVSSSFTIDELEGSQFSDIDSDGEHLYARRTGGGNRLYKLTFNGDIVWVSQHTSITNDSRADYRVNNSSFYGGSSSVEFFNKYSGNIGNHITYESLSGGVRLALTNSSRKFLHSELTNGDYALSRFDNNTRVWLNLNIGGAGVSAIESNTQGDVYTIDSTDSGSGGRSRIHWTIGQDVFGQWNASIPSETSRDRPILAVTENYVIVGAINGRLYIYGDDSEGILTREKYLRNDPIVSVSGLPNDKVAVMTRGSYYYVVDCKTGAIEFSEKLSDRTVGLYGYEGNQTVYINGRIGAFKNKWDL